MGAIRMCLIFHTGLETFFFTWLYFGVRVFVFVTFFFLTFEIIDVKSAISFRLCNSANNSKWSFKPKLGLPQHFGRRYKSATYTFCPYLSLSKHAGWRKRLIFAPHPDQHESPPLSSSILTPPLWWNVTAVTPCDSSSLWQADICFLRCCPHLQLLIS